MTLDVRINNQSLRGILNGPPVIKDQLNAVCRTLEVPVQNADGLENYLGQPIELWYGGSWWFMGFLMRRSKASDGSFKYTAYDPLYFMKKNKDDWYFKNMTAKQIFTDLAKKSGVRVASLASTGAVFPALYYQGAEADKVAVDTLARTYKAGGKRYWFRYTPDDGADGLTLFEKKVPANIWAFQVGVNLESASLDESVEETATVVKLVNRETGKTVTRTDAEALKKYGQLVHFEEVNKEEAETMEKKAQELLKQLAKVKTTMAVAGINPDRSIPQLYSGDAIYVEEANTGLLGGYYIQNVTQTFESDNLVSLAFDIQAAPDVPTVQYENATTNPDDEKKKTGDGKGVQQEYSDEVKALMDKYGIAES
jgi:hypothetical protein